jgi:hypothetical protein
MASGRAAATPAGNMEETRHMTIEELGERVASVWAGLRPATRSLVERALATPPPAVAPPPRASVAHDARAEWELSRLLAALDERVRERGAVALSAEQTRALGHMAETCALVLHQTAHTAEVFAQLFERALQAHDYKQVDAIADTLPARLPPSELCELARCPNPAVRALAHETLAQAPTATLVDLLADPVDADVARDALAVQADEYGSDEARWLLHAIEHAEEMEDDDD